MMGPPVVTIAELAVDAAVAAMLLSVAMMLAWWGRQRTGNSSWIDFGWTASVAVVAVVVTLFGAYSAGSTAREVMVTALVASWGLRLAGHLLRRARRGVDDPRYAELARQWGTDAPRRMFWFAQSQAIAALPLVLAALLAAGRSGAAPDWQDVVGGLVAVMAITGAAVSDTQLRRFTGDPGKRGKVCDHGLWRWSRHPNYFFEWLGWVGLAFIALPLGDGSTVGWLAAIAPIEMYILLNHVSGIPLLEAQMARSRPAEWEAYRSRTSAFFLWPPRAVAR